MTDHSAEIDAIVAELEAAGLVTVSADGEETYVLRSRGERVARQVAMGSEDDMVTLLDALLEAELG